MYAGQIVEQGTLDELFYDPQHPYTWGLLGSITRVDRVRTARLPGDSRTTSVAPEPSRRAAISVRAAQTRSPPVPSPPRWRPASPRVQITATGASWTRPTSAVGGSSTARSGWRTGETVIS